MKKYLLIIVVVIGIVGIIGIITLFIFRKGSSGSAKPTPTPEHFLETPLEDRPYVSLTPRTDGKELTLDIDRIKNAQSIEYELTYMAGDLSRGVIGTINLNGETEVSRNLLLGSCSKNVCKYDENVSGGSVLLRFRSLEGTRKFTADFVLQKGGSQLVSPDQKLKLTANLNTSSYYILMSTIGLPELQNNIVLGPYGVFTAGSPKISGTVSFPDQPGADIRSWDGKSWVEIKSGKITSLSTFIAIISSAE